MTSLAPEYQWLPALRGLPSMIRLGLQELGTAEVIGKGSSRTILSWRDELNQAGVRISGYSDDSIPWCGLFAAVIAYRRQKRPEEVPRNPLWARNWTSYGVKSPEPALGDILVFRRGSGGHVGLYIAEDEQAFHVLGGNQGDAVTIARIAKPRLVAARRPAYLNKPMAARPYVVLPSGSMSADEA